MDNFWWRHSQNYRCFRTTWRKGFGVGKRRGKLKVQPPRRLADVLRGFYWTGGNVVKDICINAMSDMKSMQSVEIPLSVNSPLKCPIYWWVIFCYILFVRESRTGEFAGMSSRAIKFYFESSIIHL